MLCRVCAGEMGEPIYERAPPGITSLSTLIDVATCVRACPWCAHAQAPDLPDLSAFYDQEYRISLLSDDHDQLYECNDGRPLYRTQHQAALVLEACAPPRGARVLDYGAAKASTLRRIGECRPDIVAHVFDVSRDYQPFWKGWIAPEHQATYTVPEEWHGTFDLVTAHFVLEHVADPVSMLSGLAVLLKPDGEVFLSVPDVLANPADLLVVDHLNHFTRASLSLAFAKAGIELSSLSSGNFRGAFTAVGRRMTNADAKPWQAGEEDLEAIRNLATTWQRYARVLDASARFAEGKAVAIYGAGVYGTFIAAQTKDRFRPLCFLDQNQHLHGAVHLGIPVQYAGTPPREIELVFAGLNPKIARSVLEAWKIKAGRPDLSVVYLDQSVPDGLDAQKGLWT